MTTTNGRFTGTVAFVTGETSGIGHATVADGGQTA